MLDTELPVAAIYSSAGKSIHALVKIEATNATQFKERVEGVYSHLSDLPGIDKGRKAPSQLSRLPGAFRAGVRQSLLSWTTGAPSFDAWQDNLGKRKLAGSALADYVEREIPREDILLGNRYLCRGSGMFVVAPSGVGKSVFSIQAAIEWGAGRAAFGIKPTQPLRVLIIQAEDDTGDVIEMAQIARHLRLTDPDVKVLRENVWIEPLNDLTGVDFLHALDGFLDQFAADLVIINPYTSYVGCEVKDDGPVKQFDAWVPGLSGSDPVNSTDITSTNMNPARTASDDDWEFLAGLAGLHQSIIDKINAYQGQQRAKPNANGTTGPARQIARPKRPGPRGDLLP